MVQEHEFPYPHPYYDEKTGKVNCQVCGKPFITISPRHLKKHDLTYGEYTAQFPDAPVSSEEFSIRSVYGKNKEMFDDPEPKIEEVDDLSILSESVTEEDYIQETEKDPDIEELEILKLKKQVPERPLSPIEQEQQHILTYLSTIFPNVKKDYFVEEKTITGHLKYRYITDYADPVRKIAFYFPKTFWHNEDVFSMDPGRDRKLKEDGWKVVKVPKMKPTFEDIDQAIKECI